MSKNEQEERRVWWHSQNLNEDDEGNAKGSILRHGRGWLSLPLSKRGNSRAIRVEWKIPTHFCHAEFEVGGGDGDDVKLSLACGLFAVWLTAEGFLPLRWQDLQRETGISIHDGSVYFKIWATSMGWDSRDPKWQQFSFCPADFFGGRQKYTERTIRTVPVVVPMPEGSYPATVRIFQSYWKRPRWPFARAMVRAYVKMASPVPIPGKGENSWDCEDDGIYSMTTPAKTPEDAVAAVVKDALRTRERRGGRGWLPPGAKVVSA